MRNFSPAIFATTLALMSSVAAQTPVALAPAETQTQPLTLEESIRIALRNNGQTGAGALQAQGAREGITTAKAAGLPQVTGNIGYNYLNQRSAVFIPNIGTGTGVGTGGVGTGGVGTGGVGTGGVGTGGVGTGGVGTGGVGTGGVGTGGVITGVNGIQGFANSSTNTNIVVTQNIFDGGRTRQLIRNARASSQSAVGGFGGARSGLAFTVAQRFYEQLRQQRLTEQFQSQVELARAQVEQVRAQIEVGTVARVDILSVQVTLRQRQFDLVSARNSLAQARVNFRNALGLGDGPALDLVESKRVAQIAGVPAKPQPLDAGDLQPGVAVPPLSQLPTSDLLQVAPPTVPALEPLETYLAQARALRPDLVQSRAAVAQGESSLALANIENRPQVSSSLGFNLDPRSAAERRFQLGVGLSVPIFNGGALSASKRAASDQLEANRVTLAQREKDADAEVRASYLDIAGQVERIANARVLVEQAQLNLETATERYRLGLGIVLDVTNAQTQLFSAQVSATQAVYDYEIARAALDRSVGRFAWADPVTPPPARAPVTVPIELGGR